MTNLFFKKNDVRRVVKQAQEHSGRVLLVRDYGVYLVTDGCTVAFAKGADPRHDRDWSEKAAELVGDLDAVPVLVEDLEKALSMPRVKLNFGITTRKVIIGPVAQR